MPPPTPFTTAAYAVISVVPILILVWFYSMYSKVGRGALTGGGLSRGT